VTTLRIKTSEIARLIRVARAEGLDSFDVVPGEHGPFLRVRPSETAAGTPREVADEIEAWARGQA